MKKGTVIKFNREKGLGTILGEDGMDYFVHFSKIVGRDEKILHIDEQVRFESLKTTDSGKNDRAINIRPLEKTVAEKHRIFPNPFNPHNPINKPEKFAGRKREITDGVIALINNNNVLVTGDRGIGKSSYSNQLLYMGQGDNFLIEKLNIELKGIDTLDYATISIRSSKGATLKDIAGNIIREIIKKYKLEKQPNIEHEINLKVYKTKFVTQDEDFENVVDLFNYDMIKIHEALGASYGILILIDEVENIDSDIGFANFIKNVTEYFTTEKKHINFIISGISCAITRMFFEHPSFLRLFTPVELRELSPIESYELLDLFMKKQNKTIDPDVKALICGISRGYPVNLQLLGFYAYQIDDDNIITKDDVNFAVEHILDSVKKNEFLFKHEKLGFGLVESVLKYIVMTAHKGNITFNNLKKNFPDASDAAIHDAIEKLLEYEIIYIVRKGAYYIKDQLFFRYLQKYYRGSH